MKTFIIQNQNEVYNTHSLAHMISKFINKCTLNNIKAKAANLFNLVIDTFTPSHTHSVIKIENIHNSYKKMDQPSKQIFFLYVKGYSLNEISKKSGEKQDKILITVHNLVKTILKDTPMS